MSANVRQRFALIALAAVVIGWMLALPRTASAQPKLGEYVVLGLGDVRLGKRIKVASGAVGSLGGGVIVGRGTTVSGTLAADIVHLRSGSSARRLFCRLVMSPQFGGAAVGGPTVDGAPPPGCLAFTPPLVDPALLPLPQAVPGVQDIIVPRHTGTAPLAAGSYRDFVVASGSLLQLGGGSYNVRSIRVDGRGRVVCTAPCDISVLGGVLLGRAAQLGATTSVRAHKVRVNVIGQGATPAVKTRKASVVAATVYAPGGDVVLGSFGSYRGAYVGRTVRVGMRAELREDNGL